MTTENHTAPARIEDVLALSPLQEGLFSLSRLTGDGLDLYTMQFVVDIDGPLDTELLRRSAQAMLDRHPNLRAAFWDENVPRPVQIVPAEAALPWTEKDARPGEFDAIAEAERHAPFDLSRGPALRILLLNADGARRMILTAHHILMDGWAVSVFFTELLAIYRAGGSAAALPKPRLYRDYIAWLGAQDTAAVTQRWVDYLSGVTGPLMLSGGAPVDAVPEKTRVLLPAADTRRLQRWARMRGLTLNTAVQFAWTVVLGRLTDRREVVYGTTISGRPEGLSGVEGMVGLFINTVPVAHHLDRDTSVVEQCARLQRECAAMRDIGFLGLSAVQRAAGHGTLFDTLFVFENAPIDDAIRTVTTADGVTFRPIEMESLAHYPLTVVSHLSDGDLVVVIEAMPEALPYFPAEALGERLLKVLRQLPEIGDRSPDELDVLIPAERVGLTPTATAPAAEADSVWELFERQVAATPEAVALRAGSSERFTYRELRDAAVRLAGEYAAHGAGPETVVALVIPRSTRSIIGILAAFAAGAAYVPVDITLPAARIESMLRQANPALLLTDDSCRALAGASEPVLNLDDPAVAEAVSRRDTDAPAVLRHPEQTAYLIFTSGSTGEPKGVAGTHAALASYFADHHDRVHRPATTRLGRPLRIAHAWSLSFDASWQPMAGLLAGATVHLFDAEEMRDAHRLCAGMIAHDIDMIDTTPSMFAQLEAAGLVDRALPVLALGGEAIDAALWSRLRALAPSDGQDGTAVYNCYGPTEATVEAVVASIADFDTPTIGVPNAGMSCYVLDSMLRPVPDGVVGELYLSGPQLARGYIGRAATTSDRFVADPFGPGRRMYRTGDLVRRLPHGGLGYLGRADTQVKVRGYRIEIGEIETALRRLPGVDTAAVTVVRRAGGASLVGFVVGERDRAVDPVRARAALAERLPAYMIPARVLALPQLPVNANGKLDGRGLTRLAEAALADAGSGAAPRTATEKELAEVLAELFDGRAPGLDDDFFALGVDSIVAISLVNKARRRGLTLTPRMVLAAPTLRELGAALDTADSTAAERAADYGAVPPLPVVDWLYEYGNFRRFTQTALLRLPDGIDRATIEAALQGVLDGYDTLRSRLVDTGDGPRLVTSPPGAVRAAEILTRTTAAVHAAARAVMNEIDPRTGDMVRAVWFSGTGHGDVLLLTIHHLAVDAVSWHLVLAALTEGAALPESTSYREFSRRMAERAETTEILSQRDYWRDQLSAPDPAVGRRIPYPRTDTWSSLRVATVVTPVEVTERMLATLTREEGVREFLLTALTLTLASWRRERAQDPSHGALIALEGHGRADGLLGTDTSNTLGWFTTVFPVRLGAGATVDAERAERDPAAARALLDSVTAHLSAIPNQGIDYGLLRYTARVPELAIARHPQVEFNYLGRVDLSGHDSGSWSLLTGPLNEALPLDPEPDLPLRYALDVIAGIGAAPEGPQLTTNWRWSESLFTAAEADRLAELWERSLAALAAATS
ncbi:non-ribosomal peptide synthetase [Nocardia aurantiaca]|uniref:Amino acid adenylation domain-containing protein n=1 Tax=Nocardia aurantiaca TaxID=2675850 RepID=A0A6I3KRP8_9NOCA|nr:non-ribosomal peptide synthetase [Nocardia aurantiaca]MTE11488.1 amino acid adenylation domain-containing protein [Nocardia aurantiaca]